MKIIDDRVVIDKGALQKLEAQLADVRSVYRGAVAHNTVQNALESLEAKAKDASGGYRRIFQSAFKNLEDHISVVQGTLRNKTRRGNLQRSYRPSSTGQISVGSPVAPLTIRSEPDPLCYPEGLGSSLQVFQIRNWRPLTANYKQLPPMKGRQICDRPKSSPATHMSSRPQPPDPSHEPRPRRQRSLWYPPPWIPGQEDPPEDNTGVDEKLEPCILSLLMSNHRSLTSITASWDNNKHTSNKATWTDDDTIDRMSSVNSNLSSVSDDGSNDKVTGEAGKDNTDNRDGDDDDGDDDEVDDGVDNDGNCGNGYGVGVLQNEKMTLFNLRSQLAVLNLRPEKLDPVDTEERSRDSWDFDLRPEDLENPIYEFKCPVPLQFEAMDFRVHAKDNSDWRTGIADSDEVNPVLSAMLDRMAEMAKLEFETQQCEERRTRLTRKRPVSRCNKTREKRGCNVCSQPACNGSCSGRRNEINCCEKCHQMLYGGVCRNARCELRFRQCGEDTSTSVNFQPTLQQSIRSGDKAIDKLQFSYRTFLLRPKTAAITINRYRSISEPRQVRPASVSSGNFVKKAEKLGSEPPPPTLQNFNRITMPQKIEELSTVKKTAIGVDAFNKRRSVARLNNCQQPTPPQQHRLQLQQQQQQQQQHQRRQQQQQQH